LWPWLVAVQGWSIRSDQDRLCGKAAYLSSTGRMALGLELARAPAQEAAAQWMPLCVWQQQATRPGRSDRMSGARDACRAGPVVFKI
jgi:hypothetical protein